MLGEMLANIVDSFLFGFSIYIMQIPSTLVFCIGGPYGHGSAVIARANESIRLSSLVLNHQIALIVLLEQLYRSILFILSCNEAFNHVVYIANSTN